MHSSLQSWVRRGVHVASCKSLADLVSYLANNKVSYDLGTLESELVINQEDNTCITFYSLEIIELNKKSRETSFKIGADATFRFLPKKLFKKSSKKKQFFIIMINYRTKVNIFYV